MSPMEEKEVKAITPEEINSVRNNWTSAYHSVKESPYPVYVQQNLYTYSHIIK